MTTKSENEQARMARLPSWARQEIERLERTVADLENRIAVGPEDSDTFVVGYSRPDTPLGERTTIRFNLDVDGGGRSGYIEAGIQEGTWAGGRVLVVRGAESLEILSGSGNMVFIRDMARRP